MTETEAAYIAGLFDGEGCVTYKKYMKKRTKKEKAYSTWSIELEISMTDQSIIRWLHEVLKVGSVSKENLTPEKKQEKIDKILKHYYNLQKNNVVDIRDYHRRSFK